MVLLLVECAVQDEVRRRTPAGQGSVLIQHCPAYRPP